MQAHACVSSHCSNTVPDAEGKSVKIKILYQNAAKQVQPDLI
jgi:hypothetical protein